MDFKYAEFAEVGHWYKLTNPTTRTILTIAQAGKSDRPFLLRLGFVAITEEDMFSICTTTVLGQMTPFDGPLRCDCFDGCWGKHSESWPSIPLSSVVTPAWQFCATRNIPYGAYVTVGDRLRIHPKFMFDYCEDASCATCKSGEPCH